MTWPHRPGQPTEDEDPTGVRALLAALPDPGPMPDDVAARVLARLSQVQLEATGGGGSVHEGRPGPATTSVPLGDGREAGEKSDLSALPFDAVYESRSPSGRGRRRPSRLLIAGVAAGLVAIAVGGTAVFRGLSRDATMAGAERNAASGSQAPPLDPDSGQMVGGRPVHFQMSGHAYTEAGLVREAQDILEEPAAAVRLPVADAERFGPVATPDGLASCIATLGEDDADQLAVDMATYAGQSALVIVVVKTGTKQVFAVSPGCSQGDPMILVGPLPMT